MFPPETETPVETPTERERRRAAAGLDRRSLKQVGIALSLFFGALTILVAADVAGLERRLTTATVVGMSDRTYRRGHACVTELATGYGYAHLTIYEWCSRAPWHVGDVAEVEARRTRLTGTIVVSTRDTIFAGAQGFLPES